MEQHFSVALEWKGDYEFSVSFGQDGVPDLRTDETPPLGAGAGPNPARLLAAAVGNCMSASLRFCLDRARIELLDMRVHVDGTLTRNDAGRWRVGGLRVRLEPMIDGDPARMSRCLEVFEDFCIVGQSVRQGIDVEVEVVPAVAAQQG